MWVDRDVWEFANDLARELGGLYRGDVFGAIAIIDYEGNILASVDIAEACHATGKTPTFGG